MKAKTKEKSFVERVVEKRDKSVIEKYLAGGDIDIMASLFGITRQRIYQILKSKKVPRNRYIFGRCKKDLTK